MLTGVLLAGFVAQAQAADGSVQQFKPPEDVLDYQSAIFQDVGVVQRKAMNKANRLLFSTGLSMDFSDGPYTNYFYQTNLGYALNDFWEIYFTYAPLFISRPRAIVAQVESLELKSGQSARLIYDKPVSMMGVEIVWAPLYGKDSLGFRYLVRSDTFFKTGFSYRKHESTETGYRYYLGYGKTYFINSMVGFRAAIVANYVQAKVNEKKSYVFQASLETGLTCYF